MANLAERISRDLLPYVQQPAQYVGGEVNSVLKDWDSVGLHFCLAFPDTYAIGVSHHGSAILYEMLNDRPDVLCERTYLPWTDVQERMRATGLPLFAWESRRAVRDFDILGISLQYELLFTGALNLLDLAGIPLRSADRGPDDPIVLAGGPGTNNPEPMSAFVDLFLVGDGEEALAAIIDEAAAMKREGLGRREQIARLAERFDCLYAPALWSPEYDEAGELVAMRPAGANQPAEIRGAVVEDMDTAPAATRPIVPFAETVHDRLVIEIMRGCPRRCRFCEAGHTKGAMRVRSPERILEIARAGIASTGYEEISLLGLSSSDHPQLMRILELLDDEFRDRGISIALPSLRTNEQLSELPGLLLRGRKSGLTLVPEAATERLRQAIGKDVDERHLEEGAREAFRRGWNSLKLYFMIGLPGERSEDIEGIVKLAVRLGNLRREFAKGPGQINLSVASLIPRPHTPMQWMAMRDETYIHDTRTRLRELVRPHRNVRLKFHHIERSMLEGVLARGDRRMGEAIERAYRLGARFDAWDETFEYGRWKAALGEVGLDPDAYAHRERREDEVLPWSHVRMGMTTEQLRRQWEAVRRAAEGE